MRFHTVQQFQQSADRNTNATILPDCLRPPLATLQRRKGGSGSKMPQWVVWVPCEKQWPSATDNGLVRSLSLHWWREQSFGPATKSFYLNSFFTCATSSLHWCILGFISCHFIYWCCIFRPAFGHGAVKTLIKKLAFSTFSCQKARQFRLN